MAAPAASAASETPCWSVAARDDVVTAAGVVLGGMACTASGTGAVTGGMRTTAGLVMRCESGCARSGLEEDEGLAP